MNTPRFFCSAPLKAQSPLILPKEVVHHLRVLRLKTGDFFTLFDGQGHEFETRLTVELKNLSTSTPVCVDLSAPTEVNRERKGRITLIQGLATADKMDWIIEKAVELGVHRVIPVAAQRSVLRLDAHRAEKKHQHWQRVIESASEQCGRNVLMQIDSVCTLERVLATRLKDIQASLLWVAHPEEARSMVECVDNAKKPIHAIDIAIGPEGGWSSQELALFLQNPDAQTLSLGNRILRTETAGLATVSMLGAYLGW
jgi:16S rRNA (uracil1498-N3)-methyltransferase